MAENRTINIDINQNAEEAAKGFNSLNNALDETNKSVRDVNKTFEEVYGDLQPLTTRLGEAEDRLYELAAAGQTTTQEYKDLLQTVANYRQIQIQTDAVVDAASTRLDEKLGGALQGAASGFAGAQGAMALMGNESEALEKTLVKLQGAMAIAESVRGIREGATSFKALGMQGKLAFQGLTSAGKLFAVTGIGLLITAVSLLIANFDKVVKFIQPIIDGLKAIGDAIGLTDFAGEERAKNEKRRNEEEARQLEKVRKARENAYNNEQKAIDRLIALRGAEGKSTIELQKQKTAASIAYQKELLKEAELALEVLLANERRFKRLGVETDAIYDEQAAKIEELKNGILDNENELKLIDINAKEERKNREKDLANYTIQLEKEKIDAMEDGMQKRIALLEFQRKEELKGIDKNGKKAGEYTKAIEERYLKEIQKVKDEYRDRSDRDDEIVLEKKLANRIEVGEQEIDAEKYVQSEIGRIRQEENDKEIQRKKDLVEAWTRITLQGLDLIASIAEANAGKDEKRQRAAFNIRKASNIAQATVDGYKAVLSTYADTPGGVVVKTIAATIAGGFAALKIGQIAKSKYESSSSGGGGGDLASGGTESFAPQFNVIGSSGINQLAQLQQQPVQAYVVSGEVTSAQALDRNRQKNATL